MAEDTSEDTQLTPPKRGIKGHIISVVKAALSSLPVPLAGGVASLIDDYVPKSTEKAVWRAIGYLGKRLEDLADRIDLESVDADEFADTVKSFLLLSQRTSQERKLQAAANILANLLLKEGDPEKLSYTELDHFSRCIDSLSTGAIHVLGVAYRLAKTRRREATPEGDVRLAARDIVPNIEGIPPAVIMSLTAELSAWNLLLIESRSGFVGYYADGYCTNLPLRFTSVAGRFVEYVLGEGG